MNVDLSKENGFWKKFEGELLNGQFRLQAYLGVSNAGAMFLTQLEGGDAGGLIKLVRLGTAQSERLSTSWSIAQELRHPNLIRVHASGRSDLDGLRIAYAITEYPDGKLASVLQDRCLTQQETLELLTSCTETLRYLHGKGLVHTHVRPTDILAVGETTKLSSDYLAKTGQRALTSVPDPHDAPEAMSAGFAPASDIWSLGLTVFEALTKTLPPRKFEPGAVSLHTPYAHVVQHCLEPKPARRPTAIQVLASLKSITVVPTPSPRQVEGTEIRQPVRSAKKPARARHAVLALMALLAIGGVVSAWLHRSNPVSAKAPVTTQTAPLALETTADRSAYGAKDLGLEQVHDAKKGKPPQQLDKQPPSTNSPGVERPVWHVVVFTYTHESSAAQKVAEINRSWPDLQARVSEGPPYLVLIGGDMHREAALKLRDRLLASGFPRDTYTQNFPR